jgi:hypothetical protein
MFGMRRREFITLLGGTAAALPLAARAQQPTMPVVGLLSTRSAATDAGILITLRQGLSESGFVEGLEMLLSSIATQKDKSTDCPTKTATVSVVKRRPYK